MRIEQYISPAGAPLAAWQFNERLQCRRRLVRERSSARRAAIEEDTERRIINGTWSRPLSGRGKLSRKRPLWSYLSRPEWYGKKHGVSDSEASEADQEQESEDDEEEEGEENQPRDIAARSWSYWMARGRGQC